MPVKKILTYIKNKIKVCKQIETVKKYKKESFAYLPCNNDPETVTINCVGDLMCETFCQQVCVFGDAYFFRDCYSFVKPVLEDADLTIGNLESTISENHPYMGQASRLNGGYNCNSPIEFLDAVKYAGFNVLVAANNHNLDAWKQGHLDTIRHLEEFGFAYTGIFKDADQQRYLLLEKKGIKIGILSYYTEHNKIKHDFSSGDINTFFNKYSKEKVTADVKTLKAEGADFIIAYVHWGIERVHTTTPYQQRLAKEMATAGIDYVIGSHPHALQPYQEITVGERTVPVIFSLGNFSSSSRLGQCTRDTMILRLAIKKQNGKCVLVKNEYVPCQILDYFEGRNYPVIPLDDKLNGGIKSPMFRKSIKRIQGILGKKLEKNK